MQSAYVIDVNEANFEQQVIEQSRLLPVVVDFWAPWCGPCRVLGPLLERLAVEFDGAFVLAKLNVDDNPNLSRHFRVQSIPAVKAFRNGEVVAEFVGALPEAKIRGWLTRLAPTDADIALEEAQSLLTTRHWAEAAMAYQDVLNQRPLDGKASLGLLKALLAQGRGHQALDVIETFPRSDEMVAANGLRPLAEVMAEVEDDPEPQDATEAIYFNAIRLLGRGNFAAGLDGLMDVLRQDKRYRNRQAHQAVLAVFTLLGEGDPMTAQYRQELASVLF